MKTIELLENMPKSGQFVAIWMHGGVSWADTFKWCDGILRVYNDDEDGFILSNVYDIAYVLEDLNAKYIKEI